MTFEDFKKVLHQQPVDISHKVYAYGFSCGQARSISYESIRMAFCNYNYSASDEDAHMQKILRGYADGLDGR